MPPIFGKPMHRRSILAFWKNICNIWDPVNTKIHIFPTFATINYFPRGTIAKVYREYAFLLTPFSKKTTVQKPVQNLNCHNCPNVSKVAKRIQQWYGPSIKRQNVSGESELSAHFDLQSFAWQVSNLWQEWLQEWQKMHFLQNWKCGECLSETIEFLKKTFFFP